MFKTLKNAWSVPEIRSKLIYTLIIILLYRIGAVIHVPFTDVVAIEKQTALTGSFFDYMAVLSGQAFSQATLFALSISPYITASIVMQLLSIAIPALERLSKSGEEGQKKITTITRIVTVALAFLTAFGYYLFLKQYDMLVPAGETVFGGFVIVFCYAAGASLIMWLAEKINENGIGNGISIILFANIIASTVSQVYQAIVEAFGGVEVNAWGLVLLEVVFFGAIVLITFVVFVTNSERRLPVQYAKKVVGRKMYGGQSTTLPIKLNMTGVMPIIFANSIVTIPGMIAMMMGSNCQNVSSFAEIFALGSDGYYKFNLGERILAFFSPNLWIYVVLLFILIIAFSYFYVLISFNPVEVANNLKKNGGFIPGIRPGKSTSDYITRVLNRITLIGALFLGVVAVLPLIVNMLTGSSIGALAFGGSSILIVVGVILETVREIEAQMTMRHYKGFLE